MAGQVRYPAQAFRAFLACQVLQPHLLSLVGWAVAELLAEPASLASSPFGAEALVLGVSVLLEAVLLSEPWLYLSHVNRQLHVGPET